MKKGITKEERLQEQYNKKITKFIKDGAILECKLCGQMIDCRRDNVGYIGKVIPICFNCLPEDMQEKVNEQVASTVRFLFEQTKEMFKNDRRN